VQEFAKIEQKGKSRWRNSSANGEGNKMAKVDLFFKPEHAAVLKSLMEDGIIEAALRTYCEHSGEAESYEVYVEKSEIGFDVRVRGFKS
jgi:hypothetical protein